MRQAERYIGDGGRSSQQRGGRSCGRRSSQCSKAGGLRQDTLSGGSYLPVKKFVEATKKVMGDADTEEDAERKEDLESRKKAFKFELSCMAAD
jgi:hypothetical protein